MNGSECPKCGAGLQIAIHEGERMVPHFNCGSTDIWQSSACLIANLHAAEARVKVLEGEVERLRKTMTKLAIGDYEPINGSFTSAVATMAIAALARPANQGDKA
jgi:hypothetical protein